jgi:hypothetical protein
MSGISLTLRADQLAELEVDLEKLRGAVTDDQLKLVMGRVLAQTIRNHFVELSHDSAHHETSQALGAKPTGFYERATQGVQQPQIESDGVSVSIDMEGLAQRVFGGTIEAEPGHFLTIPARAETYGKRAGEFDNLRLIVFGATGLAALVQATKTPFKRRRGEVKSYSVTEDEGGVYFWLVRSVTQAPDPTVLPSEDEMVDPTIKAAQDYLDLIWQTVQ